MEKVITKSKTQNDVNRKLVLPGARNANSRKIHGKSGFLSKSSRLLKGRSSQNTLSIKKTAVKSGTPLKRTSACNISTRDKSCGNLPVAGKISYKLKEDKRNVDTNSNRDEKTIHRERSPPDKSKTYKAVGCNLVSGVNLDTVPKLQSRENNSFDERSEDVENFKSLQIDYSEELSHSEHSEATKCGTQNPAEGSVDSEENIHYDEPNCNPLLLLDARGNLGMLETFLNDVHKLQSNPEGESEILLKENNETVNRKEGSGRTKTEDRRGSNVTPNKCTS